MFDFYKAEELFHRRKFRMDGRENIGKKGEQNNGKPETTERPGIAEKPGRTDPPGCADR
jgi:hypothetical protein